jgi:hypothetical protein
MVYLHGSNKLFGRDFILLPQKDGYTSHPENKAFEAYIESRRPQGKTPRNASVFLTTDPDLIDAAGGYNDAVYEVKPLSPPEASDLRWYSDAFSEHESMLYGGAYNQQHLDACVDSYWSGQAYPDPEMSNIEYRVSSASVVRMAELNVDLEDLERVKAPRMEPHP